MLRPADEICHEMCCPSHVINLQPPCPSIPTFLGPGLSFLALYVRMRRRASEDARTRDVCHLNKIGTGDRLWGSVTEVPLKVWRCYPQGILVPNHRPGSSSSHSSHYFPASGSNTTYHLSHPKPCTAHLRPSSSATVCTTCKFANNQLLAVVGDLAREGLTSHYETDWESSWAKNVPTGALIWGLLV